MIYNIRGKISFSEDFYYYIWSIQDVNFQKKYACPINAINRDLKFLRSRGKQTVKRQKKKIENDD